MAPVRTRRDWSLVLLILGLVLAAGGTGRGDEPATPQADETPESALVVFELDGKRIALRADKEHQLAVLESCFPDYKNRPAGEGTASWKPKYEIYFNFARGRTIRVLVSSNSRYWSVGQGPLEMRGMYFSGVVHELLKSEMK